MKSFSSNPIVALLIAHVINDGGSATFASIIGIVPEKMNKTNNPLFDRVTRKGKYLIRLNAIYANAVNNQLEREGKEANFEAKKAWYTRLYDGKNGSIVYKNSDPDMLYLAYISDGYEFMEYFVDGHPATAQQIETIEHFKIERSAPKNQGTDKAIYPQAIHIENIVQINANGLSINIEK